MAIVVWSCDLDVRRMGLCHTIDAVTIDTVTRMVAICLREKDLCLNEASSMQEGKGKWVTDA